MTSENNKSTESYVKFDGKDEQKFREWTAATMTVGLKEGWLEILISNMTLDRAIEKAEDIAAVLKNDLAYDYMAKTCTDDALEYVQAARTVNSHGDVRKAWKDLYERYQSVKDDLIALSEEYDNCKLKKLNDNPYQWYTELEYLQLQIERMGMQRKTEAEVVAFIMDWMPTEYEVVTSALRTKPVEEQTLDLVRTVYYLYWDANLKGMEQPSESGRNVNLDTDKKDKNKGDAFFVRMSIKEDHETMIASTKTFSKNEEGVTGQNQSMMKFNCSGTERGANR